MKDAVRDALVKLDREAVKAHIVEQIEYLEALGRDEEYPLRDRILVIAQQRQFISMLLRVDQHVGQEDYAKLKALIAQFEALREERRVERPRISSPPGLTVSGANAH
jgi:Rad3-related DNA helicase